MVKRGLPAVTVCSESFVGLGKAQQKALGVPDLPIAVVPHPFGSRDRKELAEIAAQCVDDIARLICEPVPRRATMATRSRSPARASMVEVPDDPEELNRFFMQRRWGDGLPLFAPTPERVARMLAHTRRAADDVVAAMAPAYGTATVERIAINAVMAGCHPEYLPLVIAAAEAAATPAFHLQALQATTNPSATLMIVNGPRASELEVNSGGNCLGPGTWANATLGRALRLILQNIGGALPRDMDRATQGQPGKYTFCCAENEGQNPWEPLHVERGFQAGVSTVTVVGALGTWNMNMLAKGADEILAMIADTMAFPASSDYVYGGAPFLILAPQHAQILKNAGYSKADVKRCLWEQSKLRAGRARGNEFDRMRTARRAELGDIGPDTMVPVSERPEDVSIVVAGGPGTHSVYIPVSAHTRSVTQPVEDAR